MNCRSFFLIIALAVTASTVVYGDELHAHCDASHPVICPEKFAGYDLHTPSMKELYEKNKGVLPNPKEDLKYFSDTIQGDEENCEYKTTWEKPYAIKSHNTSHVVFQLDEHYVQRIRYTRCVENGKPCFASLYRDASEPNPFRCKETMEVISLYIYEPVNKTMSNKTFEVPVACACKFLVSN